MRLVAWLDQKHIAFRIRIGIECRFARPGTDVSNIRRKALRLSVYGLLPFCKQIVLLTNQVRLLPYIRLLSGILCCIPSHNEYPLTRS